MSYMYPKKTYRKTEVEKRRLYLDYSCWLEDNEQLTDAQVTIMPLTSGKLLTVNSGYTDATNKKIAIDIGGGQGNTTYTVQMVVKTTLGQIKRDDLGIVVAP